MIGIGGSTTGWTPIAVVIVALAAALLLAVGPASANPDIREASAGAGDPGRARPARPEPCGRDRGVQLRQRRARPDRGRARHEREAVVAARKSLRVSQPHREAAPRALRQGRGRLDARGPPRLAQPRRHHREARGDPARVEPGRPDPHRGQALQGRGRDPSQVAQGLARGAGADRRRARRPEGLDRRPARGATGAVRVGQGRDRPDPGGRAPAPGRARGAARGRARAELAAQAAAAAPQASVAAPTYDPGIIPAAPPPDGTRASQVVWIALQYLGVPYVWGGMSPSGFDCSGLGVRLRADRHLAAAPRGLAVELRRAGLVRRPPARRPRLLQRPRAHGHVHRRRPVHPLAAHGRRGQDLEHVRASGDFVGARRIL